MPITDKFLELLKTAKFNQLQNRIMFGKEYNTEYTDYVCVNELGNLFKPDYISDRFGKIIKKYDLKPLNFHGLRHSCATMLLRLDYHMKDIQEYLGHSNYETTAKTYAHVDLERKNIMSNGIGNALNFSLQITTH